jgi:hypothetical protein
VYGAATGVTFTGVSGALYGGRSAITSDNAAAVTTAEHVIGRTLSGVDATATDFGFSFNVVTNARGDAADDDGVAGTDRLQQGTLRQFILNANAITGANAMRFVPAVGTNDSGSGGTWWTIDVASVLPTLTDANTTIDGTAYYATSGVWGPAGTTVRDTNAGSVGSGGTVGVDGLALATVARPELELAGNNSFAGAGIAISGGNAIVRNIAINGFAGAMVGQIDVSSAVTGVAGQATITGNLVGVNADGTNAGTTELVGIKTNGAVTITNNYVAYIENNGVMMSDAWQGPAFRNVEQVNLVGNEIAFNQYLAGFTGDLVSDVPDDAVVTGNYVHDLQGAYPLDVRLGKGIEIWYQTQDALI